MRAYASPAPTYMAFGSERREASGPLLGTFAAEQALPLIAARLDSPRNPLRGPAPRGGVRPGASLACRLAPVVGADGGHLISQSFSQ